MSVHDERIFQSNCVLIFHEVLIILKRCVLDGESIYRISFNWSQKMEVIERLKS